MPTTNCATDIALNHLSEELSRLECADQTSEGESRPLKGLFFGFAA